MDDEFISRLARPRPDPGGAAAAAHCALVALALLEKILRLEIVRKENSPEKLSFWNKLLENAKAGTDKILWLREEDSRAYLSLSQAKSTGDGSRLREAFIHATECPIRMVEEACAALELAIQAGSQCRKHLRSDLLVSVELLSGAGRAAGHISAQNLELMPPGSDSERLYKEMEEYLNKLLRKAQDARKMGSDVTPA